MSQTNRETHLLKRVDQSVRTEVTRPGARYPRVTVARVTFVHKTGRFPCPALAVRANKNGLKTSVVDRVLVIDKLHIDFEET